MIKFLSLYYIFNNIKVRIYITCTYINIIHVIYNSYPHPRTNFHYFLGRRREEGKYGLVASNTQWDQGHTHGPEIEPETP